MSALSNRTGYRFGRFELQADERRLLAAGKVVPLTARAFDLLLALVERAGRLVTKDELLERVWSGLVVEESNLAVQVSAVRKAVGSDAIETVPGRGYRFTLEVAVDAAQPSSGPALRHNLPRQLTSFIGHQSDVEKCAALLGKTRLLTLTGIGGLGKTRLSLVMGEQWLGDFADGVWFVELAPLADARLVSQAVASVLGVMEQAGRPILDVVMKFVSSRHLLLIFDTCEHLLHACADVARHLLQAGPNVRILATSREPLHVPGETTYALSSLSFPDTHRTFPLAALAEYEAVRLFVDRAAAAHPDFRLTKENAQAVCEICARLDGIPLALELAAARVRVLSVEAIAQRLHDRFRLLKGGDQTALPRQQTLRATIDWSHDLLTAQEQVLLRRLAVFAGGWTLEAAEAVGGGGEIDAAEVLDLNSQLTERSLVVVEPQGTRYRLLDTVRQYADERLAASGEGDATRTRHLDFFVALAEEAEPHLVGPREESWHARLDLERENLRSAHAWSERTDGGGEAALRLLFALRRWLPRNAFDLGDPVMAKPLARPGVRKRDLVRCRGLFAAGYLSYFRGSYEDTQQYADESLAIAREIGVVVCMADATTLLGMACHGQDDRVAARRHLADGLALAREAGDKAVLIDALNSLAELDSTEGDLEAAEARTEEALAVARDLETRDVTCILLLNLARMSISRGSARRAEELLRAALEVATENAIARYAHSLLAFVGGLAALQSDWDRVARLHGASDRELELKGLRREPADEAAIAPLIARAREALGPPRFSAAESAGRALARDEALAEARSWVEGLQ
jgi:predicted ATPase/DNA-binding winged helix-turn-helix (wHTH) protein